MCKFKIISVICTFALITISIDAQATAIVQGWYAGAFAGGAFAPNNFDVIGPDDLLRNDVDYNTGYDASGNLGYKRGPFRFEGEFTYINVTPNHFNLDNVEQTNVDGKTSSESGMVNLYFDFDNVTASFVPFLGIGGGYAHINGELDSLAPTGSSYNATADSFAYQGIIGINWNFLENVTTTVDYRYFSTTELSDFGEPFQVNLLNLGVIYRFDQVII